MLSNHLDEDLTKGMSTKLNNIARCKPFGLQKHHNEKFLAQVLKQVSYMTPNEGQMLLWSL